ncbi:hypothetical protein GF352_02575 [archaeon]|nr:hypothetical protein [archaeon]
MELYEDKSVKELTDIRLQYLKEHGKVYKKIKEFKEQIKPLTSEINLLEHKLTALHHYFWRLKNPGAESKLKKLKVEKSILEEKLKPVWKEGIRLVKEVNKLKFIIDYKPT